jgi:broad specificity phosphatase PhoE
LVRHGESELNVLNKQRRVFCGQFETPLTPRGREQALEVAERLLRLDSLDLRTAVSSPLERAKETLQLILSRMPAGIEVLPRLNNSWKGRTVCSKASRRMMRFWSTPTTATIPT